MSATFAGVTAIELDLTVRWNPRTGKTFIRHWKGSPTEIEIIETQARALGFQYSTHWDGGYLVIDVDYPEDAEGDVTTPLSDEWEADSNYLQKDIWALPRIQTELRLIGPSTDPTVRGFFRNDLENLARGNPTTVGTDGSETTITLEILLGSAVTGGTGGITGIPAAYGADPEVFYDLYEALTRGVTSWEIDTYVLRNRVVTNKRSTIKASRTNVGKIHNASTILAILPAEVKMEIPETGYWLKRIPKVDQIEKGKWEIVQEYWHADEYEDLIYPDPPV